jgi:hypothetical protein
LPLENLKLVGGWALKPTPMRRKILRF